MFLGNVCKLASHFSEADVSEAERKNKDVGQNFFQALDVSLGLNQALDT